MSYTLQIAIAQSIRFIAILNFVAFVLASLYLGGDASNGKVIDGHFFLGSHGHYTEVNAAIFRYSELHASTVLWALLLVFISYGWSIHVDALKRRSQLSRSNVA